MTNSTPLELDRKRARSASFVSNAEDERRLRAPHFQQTMADAIVDAVDAWLQRQKAE